MQFKTLLPVALTALLYMGCAKTSIPVVDASKTTTIEEKVDPLWPAGTLRNLTMEDLKVLEKSPVPVFVDAYAEWCGPCREMAVPYERAAKVYLNASFARLNLETVADSLKDALALTAPYSSILAVETVPTVILFKKGKEVCSFVGYDGNERGLRKNLASCLKKASKK